MKRPGLTPLLASATLILIPTFVTVVPAQEMMASPQAAKSAQRAEELLKRYDKNGDGKLDDDERADAKEVVMNESLDRQMARMAALPGGLEQFRAQALAIFDRNRDGVLDDQERLAAQKFAAIRDEGALNAAELNKRFDKNGDGTIDASEREIIESFVTELRALGTASMRSELLRRFDRDADGKIGDGEFAELEKLVRPRIDASPLQLRRYDANRNGKLDEQEWKTARSAIERWLNASGPAALEAEPMREPDARSPALTAADKESAQRRLDAVAGEVARRRALREAPQSPAPAAK